MLIYWILFTVLALMTITEQFYIIKKEIVRRLFYIMCFGLCSLGAFRWETGSDWKAYLYIFQNVNYLSWNEHTEWGYLAINSVIRRFTDNYTIFLFVQSAFYFSVFAYIVTKINNLYEDKIHCCYFPILLFNFSQSFAGIFIVRSSIAYLICILAVFYALKKQYIRFILLIFLASSLHVSAYFFLIAYPILWMKLNKINTIWVIVGTIILFQLFPYYGIFLKAINLDDYESYIDEEGRQSIIGFVKWTLLTCLIFCLHPVKKIAFYDGIKNVFLIGYIIWIWCQFYSPVAQRVASLFFGVLPFWFCMIFYGCKRSQRPIIIIGLLLFSFINLYNLLNSSLSYCYVPYKFVWE